MTSTTIEGIQAAGRLLVDARLAEWLLCDVYPDRPDEGLRVFWQLSGDSLRQSLDIIEAAADRSNNSRSS